MTEENIVADSEQVVKNDTGNSGDNVQKSHVQNSVGVSSNDTPPVEKTALEKTRESAFEKKEQSKLAENFKAAATFNANLPKFFADNKEFLPDNCDSEFYSKAYANESDEIKKSLQQKHDILLSYYEGKENFDGLTSEEVSNIKVFLGKKNYEERKDEIETNYKNFIRDLAFSKKVAIKTKAMQVNSQASEHRGNLAEDFIRAVQSVRKDGKAMDDFQSRYSHA